MYQNIYLYLPISMSSGSTGGGGGRGGDAKTIISPNTSFGDIIRSSWEFIF